MNVMRFLVVSLVLAALTACGPDNEPAKTSASKDTSAVKQDKAKEQTASPLPAGKADAQKTTAATGAKTKPGSSAEAPEDAVKLDLNLKLKPVPKLETDFEPEIETEPAVQQPVKKTVVAKPVAEVPKLKLDLSLPKDLVKELNEADTNEYSAEKALPPMFGPKDAEPKPFELSGKLLMDESSTSSHDSIDGAQLQFKFKQ